MNATEIPLEKIVCFKHSDFNTPEEIAKSEWILFARWTAEIRDIYIFAHSKPYTGEKGNQEPIFQDAVYTSVPVVLQEKELLQRVYDASDKKRWGENTERGSFKTKIHSCHLLYLLEE